MIRSGKTEIERYKVVTPFFIPIFRRFPLFFHLKSC